MNEECLICGAPLIYLAQSREMECAICHKTEQSKCCCSKGHYICNSCHTHGIDAIWHTCMAETSTDPIAILQKMMALPFCHMHGPEHHILVGSSLLTAFKNAGGSIDLGKALAEMQERGRQVPGGACGYWGACGAAISTGIFMSIITASTPLSGKSWGLCNQMTASALQAIGHVGGPRCCKRNAYLAICQTAAFVQEHLGIDMAVSPFQCIHSEKNNQCIQTRCPFYPKQKEDF